MLDAGFYRSVVYDFCSWDYVEGPDGYHEISYAFTEVADLNPYIPK